ncbi:DUF3859 domain-containing protein [Pseudomonas aeruginosa]|nr:DUF3859 domain-containing protein [Pseudomonas aeruginosa]
MSFIRSCISRSVFLLGAGVAVAAQAEVRIDGPIEYGVFESRYQDFQPGERVLTRSEQNIQQTTEVPAKLGTKFGMRVSTQRQAGRRYAFDAALPHPGRGHPDGQRHDKFEVVQKLVPGAPTDVMAYEFTEPHEVVKGEWRLMVFQGDRLLAEKSFDGAEREPCKALVFLCRVDNAGAPFALPGKGCLRAAGRIAARGYPPFWRRTRGCRW